jgi:Bacterial protein of unknown function (DUF885)
MDLSPRLRAVCDLDVAEMREYSGRHEYDGKPQDLSPEGVRAGLAGLAAARADGERLADPHDEAQLAVAEDLRRVTFGRLELHRSNPILHLLELDLACYDKEYAPAEERAAAGAEHLAAWPRVADAAVESLDMMSSPVAEALLGAVRGLAAVARELVREHPDGAGVIDAARLWTQRAIDFTRDHDLVPYHDGVCLVGPAPESRRWAMAMMSPAAPGEPEGPSWFHITPPEESWPARQQEDWLEVFSDTTLPSIAVHEVAPGHFSHGRALRRLTSDLRRTLYSDAFVEGWAHYAEELCVEEGFGADDPRIAIGVWLEALVRVTRLACAIGAHTAGMTVAEAARRFEADTHLSGPAALSEARRATFDPTYGRYTWGKLEILKLRERARKDWGPGFTLQRFHKALMDLGSPPLGLLGTAVERG